MSGFSHPSVMTLGLFEQRFAGDSSLMQLAARRFSESRMGAEMHAGAPEQLDQLLRFRPSPEAPVMVHLPREFHLLEERARQAILELATRFAGVVSGFVMHDHQAIVTQRAKCFDVARELNHQLRKIPQCPIVFVEYAVGLDPVDFAAFFQGISDLECLGPCLDIGHVGIRAARTAYAQSHSGEDICSLKSHPARLPQVISDIEAAVALGRNAVFDLMDVLATMKKPMHFHLHDGHPLSNFSPFGVSDHLSFQAEIPLDFEYRGRTRLPLMFGPSGLLKVVSQALQSLQSTGVSFTLEIHPTGEKLTLGDAASLFNHWVDKTNAEQMNHWLAVLSRNHHLLIGDIKAAQATAPTMVIASPSTS
jgi:hypothetical protein